MNYKIWQNISMIHLYTADPIRNYYLARQPVQTLLLRFRCCWIMIYGLMCYLKQIISREKKHSHRFFCHMHFSSWIEEKRVMLFSCNFPGIYKHVTNIQCSTTHFHEAVCFCWKTDKLDSSLQTFLELMRLIKI